jgi:hypothetical protein
MRNNAKISGNFGVREQYTPLKGTIDKELS